MAVIPTSRASGAESSGPAPADSSPTREDWTWPQVPLDGVTELRVHGVGGTPPQAMLDDPHPVQVSGDRIAGVMRSRDLRDGDQRWHLEAYSWGGLTGRAVTRALWLLVLPFAMVNLAGWMATHRDQATHRSAVRLAGLCFTALYVLFAAEIAMDLVAYQCAGRPECAAAAWPGIGADALATEPAKRAVLGALVPVVAVAALAALTRVSRARYEQWRLEPAAPGTPSTAGDAGSDEAAARGLADPDFWTGQAFAGRLAEVHLFTALAVVAALLAATADRATASAAARPVLLLAGALLAVAAALTCVTRWRAHLPSRVAPLTGLLLVLVTAAVAWFGDSAPAPVAPRHRPLPGLLETFDVVLAVLYLAALAVLAGGLSDGWRRPSGRPGATRLRLAFTPYALLVVAAMLTTTLFAGTALWVAGRLGTAVSIGTAGARAADIVYPQPFEALARGLVLVGVLALVAAAVAAGLTWRRQGDTAYRRAAASWPPVHPPARAATAHGRWTRRVRLAVRLPATSLAGLEWAVWSFAALMTVGALGYSIAWVLALVRRGDAAGYLDLDLQDARWLPPLALSTWVLTFLPLVALFVLRQTLTRPSARRLAAIAWDVATFFPRAFHPLGPPCYAERAVPEIQTRLLRVWRAGGAVLLLGHSQGSVLAAAAVASLPRRTEGVGDRLTLVTYGCPLSRLYARHFPAYVDERLLRDVATPLGAGRWRNVFRDTDLVGHRVVAEDSDLLTEVYLPDPATSAYLAGDQLPEVRGHGHSGYRRQAAFAACVLAEVSRLNAAAAPARPG